ncbi:hypothetical protein QNI23_007445 [Bermanella sp. WJH001]|uniref:hypothetical protein n=1 Tax=Bermanella sp. WJH001 TaxID=3048005 RepID=UPI0024BD6579|nr:hypothetical protein [Bermanella sp. WJH001]MDJ1536826.1 hypothetical protein [Bermanella sp. WJH001]
MHTSHSNRSLRSLGRATARPLANRYDQKGIVPMKRIFAITLTFIFAGCAATNPTYPPRSTENTAQTSSITPKWEPLFEGAELKTDVNYKYYPREMKLSNDMLLRGDTWNGFLKEYIENLPLGKRNDLLNGLTRFYKEYDKVDKIIKFEPLRYISGPYSSNSYVSLKGSFTKSKASALLKINYYGSDWIFSNRITIVADDFTWKSPALKFYRDHYTKVWEYTYLDLDKAEYRMLADKITSSKEVIIRFHGKQYYDDLEVTERMKQDISAMLKAIDAINKKA